MHRSQGRARQLLRGPFRFLSCYKDPFLLGQQGLESSTGSGQRRWLKAPGSWSVLGFLFHAPSPSRGASCTLQSQELGLGRGAGGRPGRSQSAQADHQGTFRRPHDRPWPLGGGTAGGRWGHLRLLAVPACHSVRGLSLEVGTVSVARGEEGPRTEDLMGRPRPARRAPGGSSGSADGQDGHDAAVRLSGGHVARSVPRSQGAQPRPGLASAQCRRGAGRRAGFRATLRPGSCPQRACGRAPGLRGSPGSRETRGQPGRAAC